MHFPEGLGGLGLPRGMQPIVEKALYKAGAPDNDPRKIGIGLGMAAPTILAFGTEEQKQRYLRPLWCGEEVWCQLFSEPGAGSDLAGLSTRAVLDGDTWIVNGQKVWTSSAHIADRAILIVRTDPDQPKHAGLSYFVLDMHDPGVEVRPLRQITGEAEFNEVFLTDARIPDSDRLGEVGEGWKVANATLSNERVAIGGGAFPREFGMVMNVAKTWRERPELRTPETHERLLRGWIDTEVARITATRLRQKMAAGVPGPEGSAMKLSFARINQQLSALEVDLLADDGLRYESWEMRRPDPRRLLRQGRRLPLPARQGQLDRGRYVGGAAQRGLRAHPRPAHRAPRRQGRALEGPAPMTLTAPADVSLLRRRRRDRPARLGAQGARQARPDRPASTRSTTAPTR